MMKKDRKVIESSFRRNLRNIKSKLALFEKDDYSIENGLNNIEEFSTLLRKLVADKNCTFKLLGLSKLHIFPNTQSGSVGRNILREDKLTTTYIKGNESGYNHVNDIKPEWFSNMTYWLNEIVINNKNGLLASRFDIIKTIADNEGGVHLDPKYEEDYLNLSSIKSLKLGQSQYIVRNSYFMSLLSIAYELIYASDTYEKVKNSIFTKEELENNIVYVSLIVGQQPMIIG
jgi:hypothetical protein